MKLPIACALCMDNGITFSELVEMYEFSDSGKYEVTCKNNHTFLVIHQLEKFQVLFEIGNYAIVDGYYREAVSSYTSSLERFYEFFTKVMCISRNIEWEKIQDAWKEVSSQSERQLGAFIFTHLMEIGKKPNILHKKKVEFRNAVIHKGKIPNKEEAMEYGQAVLDIIRPLLILLREDYNTSTDVLTSQNLLEKRGPKIEGMMIVTTHTTPTLSLHVEDPDFYKRSINKIIEDLPQYIKPSPQ
ncbi:hypothetical protein I5555_13310 [Acinetobacter baumannii]|uniref:hypothetical protein n=1 Tax=Acinetobacter baumannii TaxID=470 RepID=UPI0019020895|nr:hypothetical protein [Acinetobacter baumannii]MBJ9443417.1 hypothetical protein [Acinetobacter baumannii]MDC5602462.1 hypothetical protein [Acinetobacter baumannii]MDV7443544.1 hypothetical protein [Acinetobacter baumannii]